MRAPTVLALFVAVFGMCLPALADPGPDSSQSAMESEAAHHRPPGDDTTAIPDPGAIPTSAVDAAIAARQSADTAPTPAPGPGAAAAEATDTLPSPRPAVPPEGYRGHGMRPPEIPPKADSTVATPVPALAVPEIDTPYDEDKALEIKLKSDPEAARRYRSPRKAFFLSLLVPGSGQVYCGAWIKATFFAATEIGLGVGWYQVAIVQAEEKARQAERYAALHWRQQRYEQTWQRLYGDGSQDTTKEAALIQATAPNRESYCDALYGTSLSDQKRSSCIDAPTTANGYSNHSRSFSVGGLNSTDPGAWTQDSVLSFRSHNIKDLSTFYDLIGRYSEFSTGWEDNPDNMTPTDIANYGAQLNAKYSSDGNASGQVTIPWGVSAMQQYYVALRARSDQLARMQKWFLGGMILNHLAAAFDAALQAGRMNRELLQLQTTWLDGLGVQGGLAWSTGLPAMQAQVDWSF